MIEREELQDEILKFIEMVLPADPRVRYSEARRKIIAHVPEGVVFTPGTEVPQEIANAEDWLETRIQQVLPGSRIRDRLSKRASRRHRGRSKKYLN